MSIHHYALIFNLALFVIFWIGFKFLWWESLVLAIAASYVVIFVISILQGWLG